MKAKKEKEGEGAREGGREKEERGRRKRSAIGGREEGRKKGVRKRHEGLVSFYRREKETKCRRRFSRLDSGPAATFVH